MLFPLLATRLLARNSVVTSKLVLQRIPATQITRSFSVSRVAWAAGAKPESKSTAKRASARKGTSVSKRTIAKKRTTTRKATSASKRTTAKKRTTTKKTSTRASKKPATKKAVKAKAKPAKSKERKKTPVKIRPEDKPPKRPINTWALFYSKFVSGIPRDSSLGLEFGRRYSKEASAAWHALSDQEKQTYRDEAAAAREEYKKKFAEYVKTTDPGVMKEINRRRVAKGENRIRFKPPRPIASGYLIFAHEETGKRALSTLQERHEALKEIGKAWRALPDAEKETYRNRARSVVEAWKAKQNEPVS